MPKYAVLDVETTLIKHGEQPRTLFWGLADHSGYRRFETTFQLLRYLRQAEPLHILHHSNFDIIQLIKDGCLKIQFIRSHNGKLILSKYDKHLLLNSYAMFPVSLESIFKAFGYSKTSLDDLDKRNYEDCVHGLECLQRLDATFYDLVGQSPFTRHTIAATTFSAAETYAGKMPKDLRYMEAYRGGRVEVFDCNCVSADKFDINSSYPHSFREAPEIGELLTLEVRTQDWHGPFYNADEFGQLIFPAGRFNTFMYRDVFEKYIEPHCPGISVTVKHVEKVDLSWLSRVVPLIHKLYETKNNAPKDGALYWCSKLGLNSIYGRTGLKGHSERCRILNWIPDGDGVLACQLNAPGYWLVWDSIYREPRSNFPIASYITDNARGRLFSAFKRTIALYGDTDSVWIRGGASRPEPEGKGLGQWKYEGTESFEAHNLKDYTWVEKDKDGKTVIDPATGKAKLKRYLKGGLGGVQWTMKRMAKGLPAIEIEKEISGLLRKRVRHDDGTTSPINI